jgi:hypothetical protein
MYVALVALDRAGQIIEPGARVELEPETAAILLERGFVAPHDPPTVPPAAAGGM